MRFYKCELIYDDKKDMCEIYFFLGELNLILDVFFEFLDNLLDVEKE